MGVTLGIGHVTSRRILLFYDLKRLTGGSGWSGKTVEGVGKAGGDLCSCCVCDAQDAIKLMGKMRVD